MGIYRSQITDVCCKTYNVPIFSAEGIHYFISYRICDLSGGSNGKLTPRTCPGCSVPEPYRSPDWALVAAQTGPRAEY